MEVVPEEAARWLPTPIVQNDDPSIPDDAIVTRVVTIPSNCKPGADPAIPSCTNSALLVPLLRPMLPQYAHLVARPPSKLVIVDRYANVRRITEIALALSQ